jgi:hypothetical protein
MPNVNAGNTPLYRVGRSTTVRTKVGWKSDCVMKDEMGNEEWSAAIRKWAKFSQEIERNEKYGRRYSAPFFYSGFQEFVSMITKPVIDIPAT